MTEKTEMRLEAVVILLVMAAVALIGVYLVDHTALTEALYRVRPY